MACEGQVILLNTACACGRRIRTPRRRQATSLIFGMSYVCNNVNRREQRPLNGILSMRLEGTAFPSSETHLRDRFAA
ncbi:hypothetical protein KCP76_11165 [Salmonella enterica subsp. enterica serovar Weltevreden]|nr:hypothetical protein KCP76_11165 [Salmonella enterica subsp. enterica serovar Weltevreden]